MNNKLSDPLPITHGICQGSNLGPLTFLLYVNDLGLSIKNSNYKLFADDTVIYCSRNKFDDALKEIKEDLESINEWCEMNNMGINFKKTKVMVYGKKNATRKNQNVILEVKGNRIHQVKTYKYLGVTIDENLTFNCHINNVIKSANHKLYLLKRIRRFLNIETAVLLYKSHVLPILEYGSILFMKSSIKHLERLQVIQNMGIKTALEVSKRANTNMIHKQVNLNLLDERREIQLLKYMFLKTKNPVFLDKGNNGRITRSLSSVKLKVPHFLNSIAQKSVYYQGSNLWNNQKREVKDIKDGKIFNTTMKQILRNKLKDYVT